MTDKYCDICKQIIHDAVCSAYIVLVCEPEDGDDYRHIECHNLEYKKDYYRERHTRETLERIMIAGLKK